MKKLLTSLLCVVMVVCFMPSMAFAATDATCTGGEGCTHQAAITKGDVTTHYDTLKDAVATVTDGTPVTIDLLKDVTDGSGIVVPSGRNITFDFHDHTYTVTKELAGSAGTESQCFQLLRDSTITMKNGTINADNTGVAMLIQNYSNLTLEGMTLDGTTMTRNGSYALSNNCGEIHLNAGTTITAQDGAGNVAMDVCWADSYKDGARVTVDGAVVNGPIELGLWGQTTYDDKQSVLTIKSGEVNGEIKLGPEIADDETRKQTIESLKNNVEFTGGEYSDESAMDYVADDKAAAALTSSDNKTTYYVGTADDVETIIKNNAKDGDTVTVQQGDLTLNELDKDVTVGTAEADKFVVTFVNDEKKDCQVVAKDTKVEKPADPTKSGYIFKGWYNGETEYNFNDPVTANITLTAKWSQVYIPPTPTTQKPVIESADNATVTLSTDGTQATIKVADGYELVDVTVNGVSKGKVDTLTGLKTGDKIVVTTKKIVTAEDEIAAVKATKLVARTAMSKAKGKKAVKVYWYAKDGSELNFDGYEVYRSLKRYEGFGTKPFFKTANEKYYNTAIKKGTKYYYKVRAYKVIDGEKVYTDWSTKAWRTVK